MGKKKYWCSVSGCRSNYVPGKENVQKFFKCPDPQRLASPHLKQLAEIRLQEWRRAVDKKVCGRNRVCSRHFVTGHAAKLTDTSAMDWVPSRFLMGCDENSNVKGLPLSPAAAVLAENGNTTLSDASTLSVFGSDSSKTLSATEKGENTASPRSETDSSATLSATAKGYNPVYSSPGNRYLYDLSSSDESGPQTKKMRTAKIQAVPEVRNYWTQTDSVQNESILEDKIVKLHYTVEQQRTEIENLEKQLRRTKVNLRTLEERPGDVKFYTGLDDYRVVLAIYKAVEPHLLCPLNLSKEEVFLLTLQKLYDICSATTSKYFLSTIYTLYTVFHKVVYWPGNEVLKKHTPQCFRDAFGDSTTVIIDCFEIKGQRSSNPIAAAQQWSEYKKSSTLKYLIGISAAGSVMFVSHGYGGRASDKTITHTCGFLDNILEGDIVMADRGFLIEDEITKRNASLNLPTFRKQGGQLAGLNVEKTRKIASVRIHVERVIGVMREKYQLIKKHVPMTLIMRKHNGVMVMDMIVYVVAILVNFCRPIVN